MNPRKNNLTTIPISLSLSLSLSKMYHEHDNGGMPMSPGSMSNDTMTMMDMVMHMSFYWGKDAIILFQGWPNHSLSMYILAVFFVFLLAAAAEVMSVSPAVELGTIPMIGGLIQVTIHALRTALAYMVMLSVMSFNLGIFIAAVGGHTVGFFLVKWRALAVASRAEGTTDTTPKF